MKIKPGMCLFPLSVTFQAPDSVDFILDNPDGNRWHVVVSEVRLGTQDRVFVDYFYEQEVVNDPEDGGLPPSVESEHFVREMNNFIKIFESWEHY